MKPARALVHHSRTGLRFIVAYGADGTIQEASGPLSIQDMCNGQTMRGDYLDYYLAHYAPLSPVNAPWLQSEAASGHLAIRLSTTEECRTLGRIITLAADSAANGTR